MDASLRMNGRVIAQINGQIFAYVNGRVLYGRILVRGRGHDRVFRRPLRESKTVI